MYEDVLQQATSGGGSAAAPSQAAEHFPAVSARTHDHPSQSRTIYLWVLFLASGLMILFSWYGNTPGLNRAERMPAAAGLGLREIELPGGALLEAPRRGFIDSLVSALKNGPATDDGPFIFDRLAFEAGAVTVTPASIAGLEQLAAVLDAFPEVAITVEGHTDNMGVEAANKKLSARRAQAVKSELVALGIPAARIATVGYGSSRPIAGNGTEEGRARNRRLRVAISKR